MRRLLVTVLFVVLGGWLVAVESCSQPNPQAQTPQPPPTKNIRVNGVDLAYVEKGRGEPVVLLHGFLHDYRVWLAQMDELGNRFHVIAYSQRYRYPNGPAPENADTTLAADVEDLAAFIRTLELGRAHLIGHSQGAYLAILFARKYPELVRSVILGEGPSPSPVPAAGDGPLPRYPIEARRAYAGGDAEGAIRIFAEGYLGTDHQARRWWVGEIPLANAWQLRGSVVRSTSVAPFTCNDAGRIPVPTLVLVGGLSPLRVRGDAAMWRECLLTSEHAVLPQSSHGLHLDNPAGYHEIVLAFLARHSNRSQAGASQAPQPPSTKNIRANGVDLAYIEKGSGEPVILMHGFLLDYRSWLDQMEALGKRYRVIAYSQRYRYPNGPAPEGADTSLAADVADLAALIKKLKLRRAHLFGHSRGAGLVVLFARKHPEMVRSLILGEGQPPRSSAEGPATRPTPPPFVAEAQEAYKRGDIEGAIRVFAEGVLGPEHGPLSPMVNQMPLANAWQLRTLGVPDTSLGPFTCDDARSLRVPLLRIRGELSPPRARASAEEWQKCMPSSEHAVLPQSSHGLQLENPAAFNEVVLGFLARHSRPARR